MARFGSLGGDFGLGGMSFPTRAGTPNSQQVEWMGSRDGWLNQWQDQYNNASEQARDAWMRANQPRTSSQPDTDGDGVAGGAISTGGMFESGGMTDPRYGSNPTSAFGAEARTTAPSLGYSLPSAPAPNIPASSAMLALQDKRDQMMGRFDQQGRLQQAYNNMAGNGLLNALVSPEYAQPGFGQVNGQEGNPLEQTMNMAQNSGVDSSWLDGVFNQSGQTGTYGTPSNTRTRFI